MDIFFVSFAYFAITKANETKNCGKVRLFFFFFFLLLSSSSFLTNDGYIMARCLFVQNNRPHSLRRFFLNDFGIIYLFFCNIIILSLCFEIEKYYFDLHYCCCWGFILGMLLTRTHIHRWKK